MEFTPYLNIDRVYHGTYHIFDRFAPLSHFGTLLAAQDRLLAQNPLKNPDSTFNIHSCEIKQQNKKINHLLNKNKSVSDIQKHRPRIISADLNLSNPLWIADADHTLTDYKGYVLNYLTEQCDLRKNISQKYAFQPNSDTLIANKIKEIFQELSDTPIPSIFHFIFTDPIIRPIEEVKKELALETLFPASQTQQASDDINRAHLIKQRLIRFFESEGFDGFAYVNQYEDVGSTSYIIFRPEQVICENQKMNDTPHKISETNNKQLSEIYQTYLSETKPTPISDEDLNILTDYIFLDEKSIIASTTWIHFALTNILPEIIPLNTDKSTLNHHLKCIEQRILFGLDIALTLNTNPLPVLLACALYDTKSTHKNNVFLRKNIQSAQSFLAQHDFHITQQEQKQILQAIIYCAKKTPGMDIISMCLWDSIQLYNKFYDNKKSPYFTTPFGIYVHQQSAQKQKNYLRGQKKLLKSLYICSYVLGDNDYTLPQHPQSILPHHLKKSNAHVKD